MEEKKVAKIILSTLLILITIIAIIMALYMYKLSNDKKIEIQKSNDLQTQVSNLNETIDNLQEKINSISKTINSNTSNENIIKNTITINDSNSNLTTNITNSTNNTTTISINLNKNIKEIFQKYLDLSGTLEGSPKNLLVKLKLLDKNDSTGESVDVEGTPYITTNIKYSEFKNTMLQYVSEKCFEQEFTQWYKSFDWVYYFDGGGTERNFEVISINQINNSEYTAKVNEIMIDDSKELKEYKFSIITYNGKIVIDSCTEN